MADRNPLESVLLNLVVNARDAMVDGQRMVIRTGLAVSVRQALDGGR